MNDALQEMKDYLSRHTYSMTVKQAHEKAICIKCEQPIEPLLKTKIARAEYNISGLCNDCFHEAARGE